MSRHEDLSKSLWPDDWVRASLKRQGLWGVCGQRRLSCVVQTETLQVTEILNDGYGRDVSQHTMYLTLLCGAVHADPCPQWKTPTVGTQVSEPDLGAMEEGQASGGRVVLWAVFC